jgi:peptide deformylase
MVQPLAEGLDAKPSYDDDDHSPDSLNPRQHDLPCRADMAIYPIRTFGDPVLRMPTKPITEIDAAVHILAKDMIETMYDAPGVGLAANQIGIARRIAVFDANDEQGPRVMLNPEIVETAGEFEMDEGCLSVPGHWWEITRPAFARVRALDLDGNQVEYAGDGLLGRVLQHEIGHLDGGLLLDALPKRARKKALKELRDEALGLT